MWHDGNCLKLMYRIKIDIKGLKGTLIDAKTPKLTEIVPKWCKWTKKGPDFM